MKDVVLARIRATKARSLDAERQALREIVQEITLLGLWRAKFFEHAAFYGGTALRTLYGLDRFSEDLDFTLLETNPGFSLRSYGTAVKAELVACGFDVTLQVREKTSAIASAFVKTRTLQHLIRIGSPFKTHRGEVLTVKMEIDTDPALGFTTEAKQFFWPILFSVTSCDLPSLFAGKLHAVLCRRRVLNVKGRDWYDFLWYVGRDTPVNIVYLEAKLRQSKSWSGDRPLDVDAVKRMVCARIDALDIEAAKHDVKHFVPDTGRLEAWTRDAFRVAADRLRQG